MTPFEPLNDEREIEREREKGKAEVRVVIIRDTTYYEGKQTFPALEVPRKFPQVFLVKVGWRGGKALESEEDKLMGSV
jgi:hypothetical protein